MNCNKQSAREILQARQQVDACSLRRLREMLGDALVHPELDSSKVSRCVPDKEAGDEERSTKDTTTTI